MKKAVAILGTWALAVGAMFAATSTHPSKAATPTAPFTQCPTVGIPGREGLPGPKSTSCVLLVVLNENGTATFLRDPGQGSYDGDDDIMVGVLNQSSKAASALHLNYTGTLPLFAFDGDGPCLETNSPRPSTCPNGPTGYEGPGVSFSGISVDKTDGTIQFPDGLAAGGSTWFALEHDPITFPAVEPRLNYSGSSTGTDVFADVLQAPGIAPGPTSRLLNVNEGFSGAAADHQGLKHFIDTTNGANNEMGLAVVPNGGIAVPPVPNQNDRQSYSRGSGLEAGIAQSVPSNPDLNQIIIAGMAEQAAAPQTPVCPSPAPTCGPDGTVIKQVGPVPGDPLIYADLLRGEAHAQTSDCPIAAGSLGDPTAAPTNEVTSTLAYGLGRAAKAQLLDQGTANPDGSMQEPTVSLEQPIGGTPQDTAAQSKSFTWLVPNGDGTFGLESQTIQSIAPVSLNLGGNVLTIEVGGPWLLTSRATGKATGNFVHLGPLDQNSPTTLLITLTPPGGPTQTILKTQDLFAPDKIPAIVIPPGPLPHLAEIVIGEDPRAIGADDSTVDPVPGPTVSATEASGANDVVRVRLLVPDPLTHVAEVRVGHMESLSRVPAGGIFCGSPGIDLTGTWDQFRGETPPTTSPPTTSGPPTTGGPPTTSGPPPTEPPVTPTTQPGGGGGGTPTTAAPQVLATTFAQTPTAQAQNQQPNFTG